MAGTKTITTQVLETLQRNPGCEFDLIVKDCSDFTWNQLFCEVDRLSGLGLLSLTPVGNGHYLLRLPKQNTSLQADSGFVAEAPSQSVVPTGIVEPER